MLFTYFLLLFNVVAAFVWCLSYENVILEQQKNQQQAVVANAVVIEAKEGSNSSAAVIKRVWETEREREREKIEEEREGAEVKAFYISDVYRQSSAMLGAAENLLSGRVNRSMNVYWALFSRRFSLVREVSVVNSI